MEKKKIAIFLLSCAVFLLGARIFPESRPIAKNVNASAKNESEIVVTWDFTPDENVSSLLIFRSLSPIASSEELSSLSPIASVDSGEKSWTDKISEIGKTEENGFFYAVIARLSDGAVYRVVVPSVNATVWECRLPDAEKTETLIEKSPERERLYFSGALREQPLPYMQKSLPDAEKSDSQKAADSVKNMFPLLPRKTEKKAEPHIFVEDKMTEATGDDYILQMILKRTFFAADYKKAADELVRFLSANRAESAASRAEFYIGECYYFSGDYKKALEYFLKTQDVFVSLSRKWMRLSLNAYEIPSEKINIKEEK